MNGPPFSVDKAHVHEYFDSNFEPELLSDDPVRGGLKGNSEALELVWHLVPKVNA